MNTTSVIQDFSASFNISQEIMLNQSIKYYLEKELKEAKIKIFSIAKKYNVNSIYEFEELYKNGKINEDNTFIDYKELDRLEYKKDKIESYLKELT